jgi:6-phosphogluconate dehydrogenase
MMPGGTKAAYDAIEPLVRKMAAQVDDGPCVTYIGPGGAGHFVKTVHNGIEYGIEQILAEAYDLMKRVAGMNGDQMADVLAQWNQSEELASFLVEITEVCLRTKDPETGADLVEAIVDSAGQKGTGLWTVVSALEMGVPVPTIYAALNARVLSSLRSQRLEAGAVLPPPPAHSFDLGSPADAMAPLRDACIAACIVSYGQGMALLQEASSLHNYNLDFAAIGQIWKGGCIIRARLLQRIQNAYTANQSLPNLILDPWFAAEINRCLPGLRQVVAGAALAGIPVPCLSSSLDYIDSYRSGRLPQNLVQAMRDCFGSHTYERVDKPGSFHTEWLD